MRPQEKRKLSAVREQWIAVGDRLPQFDGNYLTVIAPVIDKPFVRIQPYEKQKRSEISGWFYNPTTHWQAIPAPPSVSVSGRTE